MMKRGSRYVMADRQAIIDAHTELMVRELVGETLTNPTATREFVRQTLGPREAECFAAIWLDNRHRVLAVDVLFQGTIDGSRVYPREVVRAAIRHNAAAVIFAHNHPSGVPEPSSADERITKHLKDTLALIDVRVLDHVIGTREGALTFSERGLM